MGFRQFFQHHRTTGETLRTPPVPAAAVGPADGAALPPEHMADLQEAWADLARVTEGSGENGFIACTPNTHGTPWDEDPDSVRAAAAGSGTTGRTRHQVRLQMSGMSKAEVLAVLKAENLGRSNWLEDRIPRPDEAGFLMQGPGWRVYSTDERAAAQYDKVHPRP